VSKPAQSREGDLLTVAQALQIVPIGRTTLYALVESGQLPHYRLQPHGSRRGRILLARQDLEAFLDTTRHDATPAPTSLDIDAIHAKVRRNLARPGGSPQCPSRT